MFQLNMSWMIISIKQINLNFAQRLKDIWFQLGVN